MLKRKCFHFKYIDIPTNKVSSRSAYNRSKQIKKKASKVTVIRSKNSKMNHFQNERAEFKTNANFQVL